MDAHTVADPRTPSPRPRRYSDHGVSIDKIHAAAEAILALDSSSPTLVVPETPLDVCEWCPDVDITGHHPDDASIVVAYRLGPDACTHHDGVCAEHLAYAERDALLLTARFPAAAVWFELPYGHPATERPTSRWRGWRGWMRRLLAPASGRRAAA